MGFWPFGRDPANIDLASRVVTAVARDGVKVRGKLTVHFVDPQRQAEADLAIDRIAAVTEQILREGASGALVAAEAQVVAQVAGRVPPGLAATRTIELAALHVVGDTTTASRLSSDLVGNIPAALRAELTGRPASVPPPPARPASAPPPSANLPPIPSIAPLVLPRRESSRPPSESAPPAAGPSHRPSARPSARPSSRPPGGSQPPPAIGGGARRHSSGWMRAIAAEVVLPPTTPPRAMGAAIGQVVRDLAGRLLIGTLRANDVLSRGLALDDESAETLAALVPLSDAPPGAYESSRASEIARWEAALGPDAVAALRREVNVATAYLAYLALEGSGIPQAAAVEALEGLCSAAFPQSPSPAVELGRYLHAVEPTVLDELAQNVSRVLGAEESSSEMSAALAPLLATITEDMALAAAIIRRSLTGS